MSHLERSSRIDGASWGKLTRHADERGAFRELWRASDRPAVVQANLSTSAAGVLRGLHLHRRQTDYWVVGVGRAFVALVDVRPLLDDAAASPIVESRELAEDDWVVIPPGVAHGFLAVARLELLYFVTNPYDGTDEQGFAWDDPLAAVPWPVATTPSGLPILSTRDTTNPSLVELAATLRTDAHLT